MQENLTSVGIENFVSMITFELLQAQSLSGNKFTPIILSCDMKPNKRLLQIKNSSLNSCIFNSSYLFEDDILKQLDIKHT